MGRRHDGLTSGVCGHGRRLARLILVGAPLLVSAGCATDGFVPGGTTKAWMKEAVSRSDRRRDIDFCVFSAVKEIPAAMETRIDPGWQSPGRLSCRTVGGLTQCETVDQFDIPPSSETIDRNERIRERFFEYCMIDKGYQWSETRFCKKREDTTTPDCVVPGR